LKIKNDGQFLIYNSVNTTVFNNFLKFKDITFTTDATFVIDRDQGVYRYKDDVWLKVSSADELVQMSSDADTIWIGRINEMYFRIDPLSQTFGDINYLRRIQSKNGQMWGSSSSDYGVLHRKTDIGRNFFSCTEIMILNFRITQILYTFLMRKHGTYAWGRNLFEAKRHLESLEYLCQCEWMMRLKVFRYYPIFDVTSGRNQ
jgi:ribulose-5-phosphate 4-epimerase/fuculose-1-phosphate aldolase